MTDADLFAWVRARADGQERPLANNSVRQRLACARSFFGWCQRRGIVERDPTVELEVLRRSYPRTYGKVQAPRPARWLTHEEAFGALVGACRDGTAKGLRDEIGIRLGLAGVRSAEICSLTYGNVRSDASPPRIEWIGKGRRPRRIVMGGALMEALDRYRAAYEEGIGRHLNPADPILSQEVLGAGRQGGGRRLNWGRPVAQRTFYAIVQTRAREAGLGHVSPHDLRRSAAGILHSARSSDGGHLFDLLDIQKVLDHADPATTQRSYIEPMDTDMKLRASEVLD
ncbi:MAG TPA: tyrosine-type recombinase/integrase [Acidimicrobiales bacterium]|nr:tyrosine-type recombinase/integrase [Acidimicrobiales bacterium]